MEKIAVELTRDEALALIKALHGNMRDEDETAVKSFMRLLQGTFVNATKGIHFP